MKITIKNDEAVAEAIANRINYLSIAKRDVLIRELLVAMRSGAVREYKPANRFVEKRGDPDTQFLRTGRPSAIEHIGD